MSKAKAIFDTFEKNGSKALEIARARSYQPNSQKTLRTWGVNEASELVGKTRQSILEAEKLKKIPPAKTHEETGRRLYTLEDINMLRQHFKTMPIKPDNAESVVITTANFKGGVAKTTTAVHLAQYFALQGYNTLFIDCDSQASGTQYFGLMPDTDIEDSQTLLHFLLGDESSLSKLIMKTHWDNLNIIPANLSLYSAEFELPVRQAESTNNPSNHFKFYEVLKLGMSELKKKYDVIIMDCPPSMGMISINAIYAADALLLPVPASMLDLSSTIQFFSMMKDVLSRLPDKDFSFIRLVVTKYDKTDNSQEIYDTIRALYADFVLPTAILQSEAIKKADMEMKTIYEIDKYQGAKKTFDRAKIAVDELNSEIESLVKKIWKVNESEPV
jgi:chromosome partitioning protein